jgi:hypothetical protein
MHAVSMPVPRRRRSPVLAVKSPCPSIRASRRPWPRPVTAYIVRSVTLPSLPCYPCPHGATCCAYGTSLTDQEGQLIAAAHGTDVVYRTRWGEWRTRVRRGRCALFRDGGCSIHDQSYYPAQCRCFPWTDPITGGRYEYDVTICGELASRPELVELQRALRP